MPFERRHLTSASELRALSHPTRLALLTLLDEEGPLTATQAGELIGESPANASFHLRTLARYGYVEEAEGGRGRQRPWRSVPTAQDIPSDELDADAKLAAGAFMELLRERDTARLRAYGATREHYPEQWRSAATEMRMSLHLTAAELAELTGALEATLAPYIEVGGMGERRPGTLTISFGLHAVPTRPPADAGSPSPDDSPAATPADSAAAGSRAAADRATPDDSRAAAGSRAAADSATPGDSRAAGSRAAADPATPDDSPEDLT
jgi:DNA-binding transcriptional ArsR family regulator